MYFGFLADAMPASKIPNLVIAEAATSDAPASAETARLRRPRTAPASAPAVRYSASRRMAPVVPAAYGSARPADTVDERRGAVGARISECYGQVLPLRGLWTSTRGIGPRSKSEENRPTRRLVIEVTTQL